MSVEIIPHQAALITGGAKRIGRAIAFSLAKRGYSIALHYHDSKLEAQETAEEIERFGGRCRVFQADLADPHAVESLIPEVFTSLPGCSLLIHNASLFERATMDQSDVNLFDRLVSVNLRGPFLLSRSFAKFCLRGHVIHLLDAETPNQSKPYFLYTWTKRSLKLFNDMLAMELAPDIRVNAVSPGLVLPSGRFTENEFERMSRRIPPSRTGSPEDVVNAVLFLIDNTHITGECLHVDGGAHLV